MSERLILRYMHTLSVGYPCTHKTFRVNRDIDSRNRSISFQAIIAKILVSWIAPEVQIAIENLLTDSRLAAKWQWAYHILAMKRLDTPRGLSVFTAAPNNMAQISQNERNREKRCSEMESFFYIHMSRWTFLSVKYFQVFAESSFVSLLSFIYNQLQFWTQVT